MSPEAPGLQETQARDLQLEVEAWAGRNMRKEAEVRIVAASPAYANARYEITCDEGPWLDGDNAAPPPLAYFSSSIAF